MRRKECRKSVGTGGVYPFVCHVRTLLPKATRSFDTRAGACVPSSMREAGWPMMSFDIRAGASIPSTVCEASVDVIIGAKEPAVRVTSLQASGTCVPRGRATQNASVVCTPR